MFSNFFIKRPIFAIVVSLVSVISGLISMFQLPIEQYPDLTPPQVEVSASYTGASANVVGTSASAKGGYPIGWGRYCKYCVPATIIVMAVSTAYLFLRYL